VGVAVCRHDGRRAAIADTENHAALRSRRVEHGDDVVGLILDRGRVVDAMGSDNPIPRVS
jgi:hypothetical protein